MTKHHGSCPASAGINAIVPIDLARRPATLLRRLHWLFTRMRHPSPSVIVGHNDRGTAYDHLLKRLCRFHSIRLVSGAFYEEGVNGARLRNEAMRAADRPLSMLLDADVFTAPDVISRMADSIQTGAAPFRILPCLYLSRQGTRLFTTGRQTPEALLRAYLRYRRAPFLHLALPSSVVMFRTGDFDAIGGFDAAFDGHGYEDLDFLLRLALQYGLARRTADLLVDEPARAPLLSLGFRSQLARLALPAMLSREVALHLWHPTRRDDYYAARSDNAGKFREKVSREIIHAQDRAERKSPAIDIGLIDYWRDLCSRRGADPRDYAILFDNRPGNVDRLDSVSRRLRFLLNAY